MLVAVLAVFFQGCEANRHRLGPGDIPPPFVLEKLDGGELHFPEDVRGKVVALRFWADWCPYCQDEMKELEPVYEQYRDKGVVFLAVNVNQDADTARRFVDKLGIRYPVLLDLQGKTAYRYQVIGLPTTYIINPQGRIHTKISGESTTELFVRIITELLK